MTPQERAALAELVGNWQANGNSAHLGDPRADVWQKCALQLHNVLSDRNWWEPPRDVTPRPSERCACGHGRSDHLHESGLCLERDRQLPCGCSAFRERGVL